MYNNYNRCGACLGLPQIALLFLACMKSMVKINFDINPVTNNNDNAFVTVTVSSSGVMKMEIAAAALIFSHYCINLATILG